MIGSAHRSEQGLHGWLGTLRCLREEEFGHIPGLEHVWMHLREAIISILAYTYINRATQGSTHPHTHIHTHTAMQGRPHTHTHIHTHTQRQAHTHTRTQTQASKLAHKHTHADTHRH